MTWEKETEREKTVTREVIKYLIVLAMAMGCPEALPRVL